MTEKLRELIRAVADEFENLETYQDLLEMYQEEVDRLSPLPRRLETLREVYGIVSGSSIAKLKVHIDELRRFMY